MNVCLDGCIPFQHPPECLHLFLVVRRRHRAVSKTPLRLQLTMELLGGLVLESVVSYLRRLYLGRRHNRYLRKVHKALLSPADVGRIVDQRIWEGLREVRKLGDTSHDIQANCLLLDEGQEAT